MNSSFLQVRLRHGNQATARPGRHTRRMLFLWVGLCAAAAPLRAADDYHDNVVILLDASGSMKSPWSGSSGSRIESAKAAIKAVLEKVPQTTHVGLLVFSAANLKNDWAYPLGPRDDARLFAALDPIEPGHNTPLGRYIKTAADRLLEERAREFGYGTYRLLVVTDGEAQDRDLVDRYTPDVIARGITVDVIGVAMRQTHTLATKVHSYRSANDSAALNRALSEIFAEIRSSTADTTAAEAFSLIAPLPDAVAAAMIQAITSLPNHPIGEKPKPATAAASVSGAPVPPPVASKSDKVGQSAARTSQDSNASHVTTVKRRSLSWRVVVVIAVAVYLIRRLAKTRARR